MSRRKLGLTVRKGYSRKQKSYADPGSKELIVHLPLSALPSHAKECSESKIIFCSDLHHDQLVVQLPLCALSSHAKKECSESKMFPSGLHNELVVQLPLSAFTSSAVPDMISLYNRLTQYGILPNEWNLSLIRPPSATSPFLAVNKLQITLPVHCYATHTFMLTVTPGGAWTLCAGSKQVNPEQCKLLSEFPAILSTVIDVVKIVSALECCKFCIGNPDEKFSSLSDRHGGVFKDYHGKTFL